MINVPLQKLLEQRAENADLKEELKIQKHNNAVLWARLHALEDMVVDADEDKTPKPAPGVELKPTKQHPAGNKLKYVVEQYRQMRRREESLDVLVAKTLDDHPLAMPVTSYEQRVRALCKLVDMDL